jgi:hypothetical protein
VKYRTQIPKEAVAASPEWQLDRAPTVSFAKVVEVARSQFKKLAEDEPSWDVRTIAIHRVSGTSPKKWYYEVIFEPPLDPKTRERGNDGQSFSVLVDFSGNLGKFPLEKDE